MYKVEIHPTFNEAADRRAGDINGLWRVVIYDYGAGSLNDEDTPGKVYRENLTYEEAKSLSCDLERELNKQSWPLLYYPEQNKTSRES